MTASSRSKPQVSYLGTERAIHNAHESVIAGVKAFHRLIRNTAETVAQVGADSGHLTSEGDSILGHGREVVRRYEELAALARAGKYASAEYDHVHAQMNRFGVDLQQTAVDLVKTIERLPGDPISSAWRTVSLAQVRSLDSAAMALCELADYFAHRDRAGLPAL